MIQRGEGCIWQIGRIWWIQSYVNGRQVRESSHSDRKLTAAKLLRQRLGEVAAGIALSPRMARVAYEELRDTLIADYRANGRKWLRKGRSGKAYICGISPMDKFFAGHK